MKKLIAFIVVASMLTFVGIASAATLKGDWDDIGTSNKVAGDAADGIVFSRHNLSSLGLHWSAHTSGDPTSVETTQICLFCHTSHFTDQDCGPLSNRVCNTGYTLYTPVYDRASKQDFSQPAASSLSCLSCHDGTTAIDMLINNAGKGSNTDGGASDQGWGFYEGMAMMSNLEYKGNTETGRTNLGMDLSDDHPIGMPYPAHTDGFSYYSLRPASTIISEITHFNASSSDYGRSDNLWSVAGYICDTCSIDDLLFGPTGTVECCTCHDPHFKNVTNTDPGLVSSYDTTDPESKKIDGLFFRRVGGNSNSGVCRTCHAKG